MTKTQAQDKQKYSKEIKKRIKESFLSQEIIEAYSDGIGYPVTVKLIEEAEESYTGTYNSEKEFAENLLVEIGIADLIPCWLFYCLDFWDVWQELRHDYFYVSYNDKKIFFRNL
jgi:antirestriction protein